MQKTFGPAKGNYVQQMGEHEVMAQAVRSFLFIAIRETKGRQTLLTFVLKMYNFNISEADFYFFMRTRSALAGCGG